MGGHNVLLKSNNHANIVFKPTNDKEIEFYEMIQKNSNNNVLHKFLPKYFGKMEITI